MSTDKIFTPRPTPPRRPRTSLIVVLLSCHLLWLQGCTSQLLVPGEYVSGLSKPPEHVVSIEKKTGELLKIDRKTGSVVFIPDSLRVKVSAADSTITIPLSEVKQITISEHDTAKTVGLAVIGAVAVAAVVGIIIDFNTRGILRPHR